jgi:two-component system chemotaxis sensor kinase CheA
MLYEALDAVQHILDGQTPAMEALLERLQGVSELSEGPRLAPPAGPSMAVQPAPRALTQTTRVVISSVEVAAVAAESSTPAPRTATMTLEEAAVSARASGEESIRVTISKLDALMAQVGELLVSRMNAEQRSAEIQALRGHLEAWPRLWREISTLLPLLEGSAGQQLADRLSRYQQQFASANSDIARFDQRLHHDTLRLGVIASQLQESVRHVRMVPFETLVPLLQRTVRDAAHREYKQAALVVEGGAIELDKKVLETIKDPLIHLVGNAVSHGIETPEVRAVTGKPPEGRIALVLQQRGAEVRISVRDDGGGFDLHRLRQASAQHAGFALDEYASTSEIIEIAFQPGVSTAGNVTSLSGRGIGLDIVRQRVESLQGRIEVESTPGEGTTIDLLVPVSLTITRALLVQAGAERYMLPLLSVEKIVQGQEMLRLDERTLPLLPLVGLLERPAAPDHAGAGLAVIMAVAEQRIALQVDDVLTEQELAVKPLGWPLLRVHNVAGAALLADGTPVIVLNAADLLRAARAARRSAQLAAPRPAQTGRRTAHLLVVDDSITTRTLEKSILESAGYTVSTAADGEQALLRLKEAPIDLVVSDVEMPNMDGIALTRALRAQEATRDLPLILVTALETREDRERGMLAGANAYIVKRGFDQAELLRTVEKLVFIEGR